MTRSQAEAAGCRRVVIGMAIMVLAIVVAYVGGVFVSKPELTNLTTLRWVGAIILVGTIVTTQGLIYLNEAPALKD